MAFGNATFQNLGGAVQSFFSGQATAGGLRIQAMGSRLQGEATRIGAAGTRINADATRLRARGLDIEAENYGFAGGFADLNAVFAESSAQVRAAMADREITLGMGRATADLQDAGFAATGSSLDILRASAAQGAITRALVQQQGVLDVAGYEEEARSYRTLQGFSQYAAGVERDIAGKQDIIASREEALGGKYDEIARAQENLADDAETAGFIMAGVHALTAVGTLFTPK